jgi:CheY-like chemotaxis protein
MYAKRALVVDDSATARKVMSNQLREQGLDVDVVNSAGEAIDYLCESSPHIIFMDYEMPGMDGFQALKAIKSNPQTAMIPVLMYTSKESGLHVGRAHALGAVGVLPKTLEPVGLKKILEDMHLLPDQEPLSMPEIDEKAVRDDIEHLDAIAMGEMQDTAVELQAALSKVEQSLQDTQVSGDEIRKWIKDLGQRLGEELVINRDLILSRIHEGRRGLGPYIIQLLMLVVVIVGFLVITFRLGDVKEMLGEHSNLSENLPAREESTSLVSRQESLPVGAPLVSVSALQWMVNQSSHFPYGQRPFSDHDVEWLNELLNYLQQMGYSGPVVLRAHWGRYCEQGDGQQGHRLPASDTRLSECRILDTEESPPVYPSVGFSNLMQTHSAVEEGRVILTLESGGYQARRARYPDPEMIDKAGDWNRIADANQFIEVVLQGEFATP